MQPWVRVGLGVGVQVCGLLPTDHGAGQNTQVQPPLLPPPPQVTRENRAVPRAGMSRTFGELPEPWEREHLPAKVSCNCSSRRRGHNYVGLNWVQSGHCR